MTSDQISSLPSSPESILIIGAGVFGISTALSLLKSKRYDQTRITVVDAYTPDPDSDNASVGRFKERDITASLDTSRIIRPDYNNALYARLADEATGLFRDGWAEGIDVPERTYTQPGLVLISSGPKDGRGGGYLYAAYENTLKLAQEAKFRPEHSQINQNSGSEPVLLPTASHIEQILGSSPGTLSEPLTGYVNPQAGWANASAGMAATKRRVLALGSERGLHGKAAFRFLTSSQVISLAFSSDKTSIIGANLSTGEQIAATITVLATGAWSASLLPSLLGLRLRASGQVLTYIPLESAEEVSRYAGKPTVLDMETGMFVIFPPKHYETEQRQTGHIKIARHGWGYENRINVLDPLTLREEQCYLPVHDREQFFATPAEGILACRHFADTILPELKSRPFNFSRICWYTDTPSSDFLIDFVPRYNNLLVASGGSGHGFKFLPVIGDKVLARLEDRLEPGLAGLWRWRSDQECERLWQGDGDSSRGGPRGMKWTEEINRS